MTRKGYSCGVLDADITGPSIPKTFGVHGQLEGCEEGILPARSEGGVQMISINLVLPHEDDPVIYRGPIIAETVKQFWSDVVWEDVDFLFVDMPPGTGDVPLTVFQSLPVDGIIVVTSPQDLVSMIVGKAVKMAKMMNIPVLGIVENYSYLECPDCGKHISVFGESHVDEVAAHYELPVLAKLPIDPKLAAAVDAGKIEDAKLPDELSGALKNLEGQKKDVLADSTKVRSRPTSAPANRCSLSRPRAVSRSASTWRRCAAPRRPTSSSSRAWSRSMC